MQVFVEIDHGAIEMQVVILLDGDAVVQRLELVGGRMTVETQPGGGTILTAVAPRNPLDTIAGPRPAGEARQTGGEPS